MQNKHILFDFAFLIKAVNIRSSFARPITIEFDKLLEMKSGWCQLWPLALVCRSYTIATHAQTHTWTFGDDAQIHLT